MTVERTYVVAHVDKDGNHHVRVFAELDDAATWHGTLATHVGNRVSLHSVPVESGPSVADVSADELTKTGLVGVPELSFEVSATRLAAAAREVLRYRDERRRAERTLFAAVQHEATLQRRLAMLKAGLGRATALLRSIQMGR